jgi:hypothetical protein
MRGLAVEIAQFHSIAERRPDHGGKEGMAWVIEGNTLGFASQGEGSLDADRCASLTGQAAAALERFGAQLDERRDTGFVRQCHGDMHLRNIGPDRRPPDGSSMQSNLMTRSPASMCSTTSHSCSWISGDAVCRHTLTPFGIDI